MVCRTVPSSTPPAPAAPARHRRRPPGALSCFAFGRNFQPRAASPSSFGRRCSGKSAALRRKNAAATAASSPLTHALSLLVAPCVASRICRRPYATSAATDLAPGRARAILSDFRLHQTTVSSERASCETGRPQRRRTRLGLAISPTPITLHALLGFSGLMVPFFRANTVTSGPIRTREVIQKSKTFPAQWRTRHGCCVRGGKVCPGAQSSPPIVAETPGSRGKPRHE